MPVGAIVVDRWPLDSTTLRYAQLLAVGVEFPPVKVHLRDGRWRIGDGRHRLAAHKLCGRERILVRRAKRRNSDGSAA